MPDENRLKQLASRQARLEELTQIDQQMIADNLHKTKRIGNTTRRTRVKPVGGTVVNPKTGSKIFRPSEKSKRLGMHRTDI